MTFIDKLKHTALTDRLLRRPPGLYESAKRTIALVDSYSDTQRAEWARAQLKKTLAAARKLPAYRNAPQGDDLNDWPILRKPDLMGRENTFVTPGLLPKSTGATGGTTGQPMRVARNQSGVAFEQATLDILCLKAGVDLASARVAVLRGDSIKNPSDTSPPFWIDEGPRKRIFSAHHLSAGSINFYAAALRDYAPEALFCYPSSLSNLLNLLNDNAPQIPLVFASSEMLDDDTAALARRKLGARIINYYGHAERIVAAADIDGAGMRFLPAYGYVELIPDGEGTAKIVATSLWDHGQVFVRYETGDRIRVPSHDPEILARIARGSLPFPGVEGRDSEYVELAGNRRIIGLNHIPRDVVGAASIQLFHAGDRTLDIFIVPNADFGEHTKDVISANLALKFPKDVTARFVLVDGPVREPNGKAPLLLRRPILVQVKPHESPELV
jgi:phenylacetate-CoA ligase